MTELAASDVAFARDLAGRPGLDDARVASLLRRIDRLEQRLADRHLYLAVVGEFSGGKSTFINALIRDPLLATSAVPTTLVATDIRHGPTLQLHVRIASLDGWASLPPASEEVHRRLVTLLAGEPVPSDLRGWLRTVTTDPRLAGAVEAVRVRHPAALLRDGIVIIDTPGTNADEEQLEITRRVVAEQADAAVVVVASTAPVPDSLVGFLRDSLEPQILQRCIFVVSKMDQVDVTDRDSLLRTIRRRLKRKLQLEEPTVLIAPLAPAIDPVMRRRWFWRRKQGSTEQLERLEAHLRAWMRQKRSIIVSDRALRLLDELLVEVQRSLDDRCLLLDRQREALEAARPRDLDHFLERLSVEAATALQHEVGQLQDRLTRWLRGRKQDCRRTVWDKLDKAGTVEDLDAVIRQVVDPVLEQTTAGLEADAAALAEVMFEVAMELADEIDEWFEQEYQKLETVSGSLVRGHLHRMHRAPLEITGEDPFAAAKQAANGAVRSQNLRVGVGAAAGMTIGTVIFPVVGSILGGIVGAVAGGLTAPDVDSVRAQVKRQFDTSLDRLFAEADVVLTDLLATQKTTYLSLLDERLITSLGQYREAMAAVLLDQEQRAAALTATREGIRADLEQVADRRQALEARRVAFTTDTHVRG